MSTIRVLMALVAIGCLTGPVFADGMIVPVRPEIRVSGNWAVKYHHVKINVEDQVARVNVDQEFVNLSSGMMEVEYLFPVPPDAAIDSMTLSVNGKDFKAKLMKADEARREYESIVRTKKDPALLEYVGYGMVKTSAFPLEVGKPAKVIVTYKTVCKKNFDLVSVLYPLNTEKYSAKPLEDVEVIVDITSKADVTTVYSPTHDISIKHTDPRHVVVSYQAKDVLPADDFQLFYKESNEAVGANFVTHQPDPGMDGYFLMMVSPNPGSSAKTVVAKDVMIVLDHSGSMSEDKKIDQAKEALKFILKNLNAEDRFAVVAFNDEVTPFSDKLQDANEKNLQEAIDHINHLDATGGTDIHSALQAALKMLPSRAGDDKALEVARQVSTKPSRPAYVIFVTDGRPTAGKTDEDVIIKDTAAADKDSQARLFTFGVGYDVNVRLLDKLAGQNSGRSDYLKPKENMEAKISAFYAKIKNPVMTDLKVEVAGVRLRDCYPKQVSDLFEGDQILLAGRYYGDDVRKLPSKDGVYATTLIVKGQYEGKERTFEYPVAIQPGGKNWRYDFVEKLWAIRRVGFLLDQIQLNGQNKEVIDELVRLGRDYGIMTPYTSFLADERSNLADVDGLRRGAGESAKGLSFTIGSGAQVGAKNRQEMNMAVRPMGASVSGNVAGGGGMAAPAKSFGYAKTDSYEHGKKDTVDGVQSVGNEAIYRRGKVWLTADTAKLDLKKDDSKVKVIKQFSDEYFELVRANTVTQNKIMATQVPGDELVIQLRGQIYRIKS